MYPEDSWVLFTFVFAIAALPLSIVWGSYEVDHREEKFKTAQKKICSKYIGKTIIDKQIPDLLLYENKNYLNVSPELYSSKNVGDKITDKECLEVRLPE